jgi:hypothetical protein
MDDSTAKLLPREGRVQSRAETITTASRPCRVPIENCPCALTTERESSMSVITKEGEDAASSKLFKMMTSMPARVGDERWTGVLVVVDDGGETGQPLVRPARFLPS